MTARQVPKYQALSVLDTLTEKACLTLTLTCCASLGPYPNSDLALILIAVPIITLLSKSPPILYIMAFRPLP
jgi:hypothetical protein